MIYNLTPHTKGHKRSQPWLRTLEIHRAIADQTLEAWGNSYQTWTCMDTGGNGDIQLDSCLRHGEGRQGPYSGKQGSNAPSHCEEQKTKIHY
jgi:hypothetical protein